MRAFVRVWVYGSLRTCVPRDRERLRKGKKGGEISRTQFREIYRGLEKKRKRGRLRFSEGISSCPFVSFDFPFLSCSVVKSRVTQGLRREWFRGAQSAVRSPAVDSRETEPLWIPSENYLPSKMLGQMVEVA